MDDAGIDIAISTPGVHLGNDSAARDLACCVNELSAELIQERFGGFAALPLPDVDGSLCALEYGLDVLKMDGVVLFSNAHGIYLGDTRFRLGHAAIDLGKLAEGRLAQFGGPLMVHNLIKYDQTTKAVRQCGRRFFLLRLRRGE